MRIRPIHAALGVFAAFALAAPVAHGFTVENQDGYTVPKFDLEEQAKQFRKGGTEAPSFGRRDFTTPFGPGTVEFGVRQSPGPVVGTPFTPGFGYGSTFNSSQSFRNHFERVLTPDNLK